MPDYNRGKIYKIYNTITDDIYIGATTRPLNDRLAEHRRAGKAPDKQPSKLYIYMYEHGANNFKIELLENYNCNSRQELHTKEGEYIQSLTPFLNMRIAGQTPKMYYKENYEKIREQIKQYKQNNKNEIAKRNKQYYQTNKTKREEHDKQYYQANKEKIAEHHKQYYR